MSTVAQAFQSLGLVQWWNFPTQTFGQNGEKGTDFGMGGTGKPVGSLTPGRVVYVGDGGYPGSSIGQIVQVLTPDGKLLHYQHLKSSNVSVGQSVQVGTPVGTSGGCPVGAYSSDGQSCTRTDTFTTGQHIEVRIAGNYNPANGVWSQAWINPLATFISVAGQPATNVTTSIATSGSSSGSSGTPSANAWVDQIRGEGIKIGLFVLALVLAGFGFYLLFQKQMNGIAKNGLKAAKTAAEVAA